MSARSARTSDTSAATAASPLSARAGACAISAGDAAPPAVIPPTRSHPAIRRCLPAMLHPPRADPSAIADVRNGRAASLFVRFRRYPTRICGAVPATNLCLPSYVQGSTGKPLLGQTIGESLQAAAAQFGERDALISCHQEIRYTYRELRHQVTRAARALLHLGVARGDRVGIWSPNTAEWVITQYAAASVGAILVNVNPSYRLRELEYALTQSGIQLLIAARVFRKINYVEMLTTLMPEMDAPRSSPLVSERIPALRDVV